MSRALRAMLSAVVDYAGLFPPAKLDLGPAVANFVRYANEPDSWMLGKFVCPTAKLADLAALLPAPPHGLPWGVSALGRGGDTIAAWIDAWKQDLAVLDALPSGVRVAAFEVRLPSEALTAEGVAQCLDVAQRTGMSVFVEVPAGPGFVDRVRTAMLASSGRRGVGIKLRCGGLEASAFPDSATLAAVLADAARYIVALKATAGLHHPFRHRDESIGVWMHGFVNLFFAAIAARQHNLDVPTLTAILDDADPTAFRVQDATISWRDCELTCTAIHHGRRDAMLSFGSCSFDEPREDLRAAGWLTQEGA